MFLLVWHSLRQRILLGSQPEAVLNKSSWHNIIDYTQWNTLLANPRVSRACAGGGAVIKIWCHSAHQTSITNAAQCTSHDDCFPTKRLCIRKVFNKSIHCNWCNFSIRYNNQQYVDYCIVSCMSHTPNVTEIEIYNSPVNTRTKVFSTRTSCCVNSDVNSCYVVTATVTASVIPNFWGMLHPGWRTAWRWA